ncbi:MAG: hypothetical protein VYA27_12750 [Verrucomicrobiota bacterium]|nr:hypothetical protein [Verrucomicrobiota bacterium]
MAAHAGSKVVHFTIPDETDAREPLEDLEAKLAYLDPFARSLDRSQVGLWERMR